MPLLKSFKVLITTAAVTICLQVIAKPLILEQKDQASSHHQLISDFNQPHRIELIKSLKARAQANPEGFNFPEVRHTFNTARTVIRNKLAEPASSEAAEVLTDFLRRVDSLEANGFPYRDSIEMAFIYTLLIDQLNYPLFFKDFYVKYQTIKGQALEEGPFPHDFEIGQGSDLKYLGFLNYPDGFSIKKLYRYLIGRLIEDSPPSNDPDLYTTNLLINDLLKKISQPFLFIPTFASLDFRFFLQTMHYNIYPIGLMTNEFIKADGQYMSPSHFFRRDLGLVNFLQNKEDQTTAELFIEKLYESKMAAIPAQIETP